MKKITMNQLELLIQFVWSEYLHQASSEDLYQSVISCNWDSNNHLLDWIMQDQTVDQAVILAVYWMSDPTFAKRYMHREDVLAKDSWYVNNFDFIENLEEKYIRNFWHNNEIAFNPAHDQDGVDWTMTYDKSKVLRPISEKMFIALTGKKMYRDENFQEGLTESWNSKIWMIFDEHEIVFTEHAHQHNRSKF